MSESSSNNKRIVKNTLFLYFRMLLLLFVSLYTARITLEALGAEDYGLYNVVAGIVVLFSFLNGSLTSATSRYLTYELGSGNIENLKNIFANTVVIHAVLGLFILIVGESLGLYIVNNVLVIPTSRIFACNVAYQIVILSTIITLIQTPFSAAVISYEKMNLYAYLGIFDAIAKLIICYIIQYTPYDRLIMLSILHGIVTFIVFLFYVVYCKSKLKDAYCIRLSTDKKLVKSMLKFTTWSLIGSIANILKNQGVNIIINIFFGATVNAANAIAYRVNAAVTGFTSNFTTAMNPQITKSYASSHYEEMKNLIYRGGKFTFFMLMILGFPIMFGIDSILELWLGKGNVPQYTSIMTILVLVLSMVETFTYSIGCAVQATGNIRNYQIVISGITLLNLPISYLLYLFGCPPYSALGVSIFISSITLICRLYFIKELLGISPKEYIQKVFCCTFGVAILCLIVPISISLSMETGTDRLLAICVFSTITNCIGIWFLGMEKTERAFVTNHIKRLIKQL